MGFDLLADLVAALHFAYVSFVVVGLGAIVVGLARRWHWVRNPFFRLSHLLAILIVAGESLLGIPCPLTMWEDRLRALAGHAAQGGSFLGRLLDKVMFVDVEPAVLTWIYVGFALLVLMTLVVAPPRWRKPNAAF
jgi:Protein of Unknown function (DUF2784)